MGDNIFNSSSSAAYVCKPASPMRRRKLATPSAPELRKYLELLFDNSTNAFSFYQILDEVGREIMNNNSPIHYFESGNKLGLEKITISCKK